MPPRLFIDTAVTPCVASIHALAARHGIKPAETAAESEWILHLASPHITLTAAEKRFSTPSPTDLPTLSAFFTDALHQWKQRPLPLGAGWEFAPTRRACIHPAHAHIELTDKETMLLAELLAAHPRPLGREHLLAHVWAYDNSVDSHTLETHIYRLRGKCEQLTGLNLEIRAEATGYTLTGMA